VTQLLDKPLAAPKFNVVTVEELLRPFHRVSVAVTNEGPKASEMPVFAYDEGPILCQPEKSC
jgi:hypothetical protein